MYIVHVGRFSFDNDKKIFLHRIGNFITTESGQSSIYIKQMSLSTESFLSVKFAYGVPK